MSTRRQGMVKFYDARRGFGFIVPDDGGPDIFVHHTAVARAGLPVLLTGMRLSFELAPAGGNRPPQADRLLLLGDDEDGASAVAGAQHDEHDSDGVHAHPGIDRREAAE